MGRLSKAACAFAAIVALLFVGAPAMARGGGWHGGGHEGGHAWHGGGGWHGHGGGGWHGHGGSYWYPGFRLVVPFYWGAGPLWGPGWWGPPYPAYSYPYPYPAAPGTVVQPPQGYVQQPPQYWYYCRNPEGYYPYVQSCPGGWTTVQPPAGPPEG